MNKKIISLATVIMIAIPYVSHAITERISIDSLGIQSDGASYNAAMSEDARYVFFSSYATNLVPNDTNRQQDIFMRDRISNTTTRISVSTSGDQGNGYSTINASQPVSTNGQFIIFNSQATNLVPNDTNSIQDVFIRDTVNNITTRISVSTSGDQGNNHSYGKAITPDGRYVLFYSYATNLVPNDTNGQMDLFVRDTINNTTVLVTTDDIGNISNGYSSPISITPDGRYVLFQSNADNLVANDTNFSSDGFVRDLVSNTTTIISVSTSGDLGNNYSYPGTITPDGRYILFYSDSDNLVPNDTNSKGDLFVRDLVSNTTTIVTVSTSGTQANGYSWGEFMSDDGRYVFFSSDASTLVPNDTNGQHNVFVRDLLLNTTTRLSVATNGDQGNGYSEPIDISSNGRYVLFYSDATNLVQGDTNWHSDVFIRDTVSNTTTAVTVDSSGIMGNNGGNAQYYTSISSSGNYVWFYSDSNNLVPNDTNGQYDIFINEWQVILGAAPSIVEPVNGSYRNSTGDIEVEGIGVSGADVKVTFLGNEFLTTVDSNNEWGVVLPWQLDGTYTVYAQQKEQGAGAWSATGSSTFTIDTIKPSEPTIITPIENTLISGGSMYVVGQGEVGGTVVVKVGKQVKEGSIDGLGNWNVGPFTIVPGYKYGIVAKQRDMANNESEWTLPRTVYGVQGGVTGVNINNYLSDLILYKKGVTSTNSETTVNPNEDVTYTLDYLNGGKGYSTGVIIVEDVPENTCFTVGSISGLNNDYVVEYSNTDGVNYGYTPLGSTGAQDCAITHFRVKMLVPYEAKSNVVNDGLGGVTNNILGNSVNGLRIISSFITGYYQTILYSTGNISGWDKLLIQDDIISGDNKIEYSVYGTLSGNICNTGSILVGPQPSYNNEIDISSISGENSSICVKAEFSIMSGTVSPVLRSIIGLWNNEDKESFTFDVKVKGGHYSGTAVTNIAYIGGSSVDSNTGNNTDMHILTGLPNFIAGGGGYGGGEGKGGGGGDGKGDIKGEKEKNDKKEEKKVEKVESPQEKAEKIKEIDMKKPEKPVVEIPKKEEIKDAPKSVEITPTTPNIAIKEAIVQTSYVREGSSVDVKTVENPVLKSEKRCYSPKEVVEITLGKEKTNKDLLVYQALLKSYDLTIFSDTDSYKPQNGLKRYEAAKMFTNFAKHILCREKTNEYKSNYVDIEGIDETLKPYIIEAYEYGILRGSNDRFRPLDRISRKEFVAALMRMFVNQNLDVYNVGNEWDKEYVELFEYYGLESIVGEEEEIDRYEMSKIMYKLYYNTSYEWTEKGYVLPLKKK